MTQRPVGDLSIEMDNVTKTFGDKTVVDNLSLRIPRGTAFGFIGPNGAGKTTTIKMLMGLLPTDTGAVKVLDIDVNSRPDAVSRRVGYVPEQHFIYRWMRVKEVLRFCRSFYPTWNDKQCEYLLDLFALPEDKKVKALSRGMTVKLALLLAVVHEPELLILDEPTTGLDPIAREEFLDGVLRTVCDQQRTILFSSHTLSDIQRLADSVGIIYAGKLVVHRAVDDLLSSTKRIRAILNDGRLPANPPSGTIWQHLRRREWLITVSDFSDDTVPSLCESNPVGGVDVIDIGLEDIFKDYIKGRSVVT